MIEAAALAFWGIVVHRICDWLLQSDWMAKKKAERAIYGINYADDAPLLTRGWETRDPEDFPGWWSRHPAAYAHSGVHLAGLLALAALTPWTWWAALVVAAIHLVIDTRAPVAWWARLVRQTEPETADVLTTERSLSAPAARPEFTLVSISNFSVGHFVRMQVDQVFHEVVICALAILLVIT